MRRTKGPSQIMRRWEQEPNKHEIVKCVVPDVFKLKTTEDHGTYIVVHYERWFNGEGSVHFVWRRPMLRRKATWLKVNP